MHITDHDDRVVKEYNPLIDTEVDFDCPYIDFSYALNKDEITIPKSGVYDTLYYLDDKILIVNEVSEIEIRFYSSDIPNESYRIGQRHIKGRVRSIKRVQNTEDTNSGFSLSFDSSSQYNGKISNVTIDKNYVKITNTRCIVIEYFNDLGKIINELVIPIKDWFSQKVYLNSAYIIASKEQYPFKENDIVDTVVYIKDPTNKNNSEFTVIEKKYTGRLHEVSLIERHYNIKNEQDELLDRTVYYYMITIDLSQEYEFEQVRIASTVVKSMKLHKSPDIEP